jgi:uncharacterized membrane protein
VIRRAILYAAVLTLAIVLGANLYNSVVDARNWGADIPASLATARQYFAVADPGHFFRIFSPLSQVFALTALVACWKIPGARLAAGVALMCAVGADVLTFAYFYPRNAIMLAAMPDVTAASAAWREWSAMNHVRSALVLVAGVAELFALSRLERLQGGN